MATGTPPRCCRTPTTTCSHRWTRRPGARRPSAHRGGRPLVRPRGRGLQGPRAMAAAMQTAYGRPTVELGQGGSIPALQRPLRHVSPSRDHPDRGRGAAHSDPRAKRERISGRDRRHGARGGTLPPGLFVRQLPPFVGSLAGRVWMATVLAWSRPRVTCSGGTRRRRWPLAPNPGSGPSDAGSTCMSRARAATRCRMLTPTGWCAGCAFRRTVASSKSIEGARPTRRPRAGPPLTYAAAWRALLQRHWAWRRLTHSHPQDC